MLKRMLLSFLGENNLHCIRGIAKSIKRRWLRIASRSELLCRVHALLFTRSFSLEARAVVAGQIKHFDNRANQEAMNYFLRRGIHRLEKGLIMPERRALFALDFIEDLVATYSRAVEVSLDVRELFWAQSVLSVYFDAVIDHPAIARAREMFRAIPVLQHEDQRPSSPYRQDREGPAPVLAQNLLALAERRRSVRFFKQERVPRHLLDAALSVAVLSPSACNRQPISFRVFDNPERASEVAQLAGGTAGFADNIPCTVAIVGRLRAYPYERDRHVIYIDGGLAAMSFMLTLETVGLASCPINWPDVRERELAMARLLELEDDERVVMLIAVGKPDPGVMVPASTKLSPDVFRTYADSVEVLPAESKTAPITK